MKGLFKSVVTLLFIAMICVIAYFLLMAMRKLYIQSWFVPNRSVLVGFLSGLILTSLIAFSNLIHTQRAHARDRAANLDGFLAEAAAFQALLNGLQNEQGALEIPQNGQYELGASLARLNERANSILRCEKVSPLKYSAIQRREVFASPIARTERAFDLAFAAFEESCVAAYHTHSSLPYLTSESEQETAVAAFLRQLKALSAALDSDSAMKKTLLQYRGAIGKFLGEKRAAS